MRLGYRSHLLVLYSISIIILYIMCVEQDVEFKKKQALAAWDSLLCFCEAEEKKAMAAAAKSMGKKKLGSLRDTEFDAEVSHIGKTGIPATQT